VSRLLVLIVSAVIAGGLLLLFPRLRSNKPPSVPAFIPDLKNNKTIVVRGWREAEVAVIVNDFARVYDLNPELEIRRTQLGSELFRLSFPEDIEPGNFFFFVNYLRYPKHFDPKGRKIGVLGRSVLTSQFDIPEAALVGKSAEVYVPSNDDQFDTVYVRVNSGQTYENSFAAGKWKLVGDARFPEAANGL